jgi:hypothetical protein
MDYDVTNYSTQELLEILGLPDKPKDSEIQTAVDGLSEKHKGNSDLVQFIQEAGRLLQSTFEEDSTPVFQTDVRRGSINPDTKNTVTRMVNLDSSYRELIDKNNAHTDSYTCILSEPLNNVVSIALYSIELPMSWYNFSDAKGNTKFSVTLTNGYTFKAAGESPNVYTGNATIPDGNYTVQQLVDKTLNTMNVMELYQVPPTFDLSGNPVSTTLSAEYISLEANIDFINGKYVWVCNFTGSFSSNFNLTITWYDPVATTNCPNTTAINNNLGWYLGFRSEKTAFFNVYDPKKEKNNLLQRLLVETPSLPNVYGTKYIVLRLNDFRANRLNKALIGIRTFRDKYIPPLTPPETLSQLTNWSTQTNAKGPRRLTMHQMYAANAIQTNNIPTPRIRTATMQDETDILAKIPIKRNAAEWLADPGKLYVEFSGSLQTPVREYFGPCNIGTLSVSLCDDKGSLLDLNGLDWSCTLLVTSLYSY